MGRPSPRLRRVLAAAAVVPLLASGLAVLAGAAPAEASPATVSSTALPTAQINGVVWSQVIVGDTVYVGGQFTAARPAGAKKGAHTVKRRNLLAYDLTTGKLTGWKPRTNGMVRSLAASADGRTIYAGGTFTSVNTTKRLRLAAFDARSGGLRKGFAPKLNASVDAVAVHGTTVYIGGVFTSVGDAVRKRAAALNGTTGAPNRWSPKVDDDVLALVVAPDGGSVVLAGRFDTVNGQHQPGSQRVSTGTGHTNLRWTVNATAQNHGPDAAIFSLSSDGTYVYGTGYSYGPKVPMRRLEGTFSARWSSGTVHWIEDCHGDSYSSAELDDVVYIAGHPHDCATVPGGFAQTEVKGQIQYHRALAFTRAATGVLTKTKVKPYTSFAGKKAPTLLAWRPDFDAGTVTGMSQGPWSVVAAGKYVAYAGEFVHVNGHLQQGLARFSK